MTTKTLSSEDLGGILTAIKSATITYDLPSAFAPEIVQFAWSWDGRGDIYTISNDLDGNAKKLYLKDFLLEPKDPPALWEQI